MVYLFVCNQGNAGRLDFNLKDYTNKNDVMDAIGRIGYLGENTNLTGGLKVSERSLQMRNDCSYIMSFAYSK